MDLALGDGVAERFVRMAEESMQAQRRVEADDTLPFEAWRQQYLEPFQLGT
jgi:glutamate--cysteine ligase